jgi:hypothetical protein
MMEGETERSSIASEGSVASQVKRITERERTLGFAAAAIAAVLWAILTVPDLLHPPKHLAKGQPDTTQVAIYLGVGMALACLIFAASIIRRRALLGFAALFTGASFGSLVFLALPFWAFGGWLLWRAFRIQRDAASRATTGHGGPSPPARRASSRAIGRGSNGAARRTPPPPSKRYTPPKPPPKRPRPKPEAKSRDADAT